MLNTEHRHHDVAESPHIGFYLARILIFAHLWEMKKCKMKSNLFLA